jgi:Ferritin-like
VSDLKIGPWQQIEWKKPAESSFSKLRRLGGNFLENFGVAVRPDRTSLRAVVAAIGDPSVAGKTPLEEARILLRAACEVEHALLVEYLYTAWSLGRNPIALPIVQIAIQEMCHFVTVQNLMLFVGSDPSVRRQDQDPVPELDPFPFSLRPFSSSVLEDFLLTEMPPVADMLPEQKAVMQPIIDKRSQQGSIINRVGVIYAKLYWLFQTDDSPTADWPEVASAGFGKNRHIASFPGEGTSGTFQVDPLAEPKWHSGDDRGGVFENVGSREAGLKTLVEIASQGEGMVGSNEQQSHFAVFLDIYRTTDFTTLPASRWPTDPFVSDQPAPDPAREANRISHPAAAALCKVFDARYRIALASIRAALSRDRTKTDDLVVRAKYVDWAFDEMVSSVKNLAKSISKLPCKAAPGDGTLMAAPTFNLDNFSLPDDAAGLDAMLADLHRAADSAINDALSKGVDAGTRLVLQQILTNDKTRFPDLVA